jgi:hypothetical protein
MMTLKFASIRKPGPWTPAGTSKMRCPPDAETIGHLHVYLWRSHSRMLIARMIGK